MNIIRRSKDLSKTAISLFSRNWKGILSFLILYSLAAGVVVGILSDVLFDLALKSAGVFYVAMSTLKALLTSPVSLLCLLASALLIVYATMVELSALMYAFRLSEDNIKTTGADMLSYGLTVSVRAFRPRNWLMLLVVLVLLPFVGGLHISAYSFSLKMPGFIKDFIFANTTLAVLYIVGYIALVVLGCRLIFSIVDFGLTRNSYMQSCRNSLKMTHGRNIHNLVEYVLLELGIGVVFIVAAVAVVGVVYGIAALLGIQNTVGAKTAGKLATVVALLVGRVCQPVVVVSILATVYFDGVQALADYDIPVPQKPANLVKRWHIVILSVLVVLSLVAAAFDDSVDVDSFFENCKRPLIVAHRGDSVRCPENTYPAFQKAIVEENVPWIELDVHQTKDGEIIISHDDSIKRISGIDAKVYDLTWDELQKIDVGSWFSSDFSYVRLSKLVDVLKLCKAHGTKVQIEIKPTSHDNHIEEGVLQAIEDTQTQENAYVLSLKTEPLIRTKEISPATPTIYCMAIGIGNMEDAGFADNFSIEESNLNQDVVNRIHKQGKLCFAWTINDPESVQYLIDCGVDGLLTDDPVMMKSVLDEAEYSGGLERFIRLL